MATPAWIRMSQQGQLLSILVATRASSNRIIGEHAGYLKIALTSAPVDGQANLALTEFLSKTFKIPKSEIEIIRGKTSKRKIVRVPSHFKLQ